MERHPQRQPPGHRQRQPANHAQRPPQVSVTSSNWYNPLLKFPLYMVPAILVTLITAMVAMQSAFNIVQEKESRTIEQINVTPIKKHIFIIGKMIPFLTLGIVLFTMGLLVGRIS
jgi:ABC-2 type transport system permease protein